MIRVDVSLRGTEPDHKASWGLCEGVLVSFQVQWGATGGVEAENNSCFHFFVLFCFKVHSGCYEQNRWKEAGEAEVALRRSLSWSKIG